MSKTQQTPWLIETISGAAGGFSNGDVATLRVTTRAATVEEIRAKVAALPALLEALEVAVDILVRLTPPIQQGTLCEEQDHATALRLARAAIAKAKGGAN